MASAALLLAAAGSAQAASNPFGGRKSDSNAPIEITSDALSVFQEENRALFTGHVVAIQGTVRLKADSMNVFYRSNGSDDKKPAKKSPAGATPGQQSIDKIDVAGGVFLSTPEETASGAAGVYDVSNREIRLNGNVVLTRDKNVLKGDRLVYHFDTGKSTLEGGAPTTAGGGKQRVRALFVPDKKGENK